MAGDASKSAGADRSKLGQLAEELTGALLQDSDVKALFDQYLTSSGRDLHRFVTAFLEYSNGGSLAELGAAATGIVDIAAVAEPVTKPDFVGPMTLLQQMYTRLQEHVDAAGPPDLLTCHYERALAERAALLQQYFRLRPSIATLLLDMGEPEAQHDLSALARRVHEACCSALLQLLDAKRALVYYRKAKAFDFSSATFERTGQLCAVVAMVLREGNESAEPLSELERVQREREQAFLQSDTSRPTRGLHAVPELAAVLEQDIPLLMLANAGHYAMIREHASRHFPPLLLALEYVMSVVYHRKYIQRLEVPAADELRQLPLEEYYADPHWQFFNGGFYDYVARITIPIGSQGSAFAFIAVDSFNEPLGMLGLDDRARRTLLDYELYRRRRKSLQGQHLSGWLREHEPQLVREMLAAAPDAVKNEDEFLRHRAMDFMDAECAQRFFDFLRNSFSISFDPSPEELDHLTSHFNSPAPISRQRSRFAALLGEDIAASYAALDALAATETRSHRAALIHVNKERNLTSRTLRHEGINKLTAMRNSVLDLNDYLLALDQAWKHYVEDFGRFSERHIDDSLYGDLGKAVKPLYNLLEERHKSLQAIQRCNNIGRDLNDLLLRYKGAEFRKGDEPIHSLIDEVLDMYNELYFVGSRIELVREYCDPALKVFCYRDLLITVFCAYLDNAYEALLKTEGKRSITITTTRQRDFFHFIIADSGCGFADVPAVAANPMLLYSGYTSNDGEGHGVGLTIVREIIEDVEFHNGRLDTPTSTPGQTTFGFAIPLEEKRSVQVVS